MLRKRARNDTARQARSIRSWPMAACQLVGSVARAVPGGGLRTHSTGLARGPAHGGGGPAGTRRGPGQGAPKGIDDVVDHYARIIRGLEAPPVVIGHSFGGLIAQRLLGQDLAAAAVAIDAAPIKGVLNLPVSALRVASIALRKPANRNLAISLTTEQFRYGFGNALPEQESAELYDRWTVPSPGKPLFEAALANFTPRSPAKVNTGNKTRGPLLLTAGGKDHTVPAAITTSTRKLYHKSPAITDFIEFPDRGHSLTIDHGWREVAQAALDWLRQRSL